MLSMKPVVAVDRDHKRDPLWTTFADAKEDHIQTNIVDLRKSQGDLIPMVLTYGLKPRLPPFTALEGRTPIHQ